MLHPLSRISKQTAEEKTGSHTGCGLARVLFNKCQRTFKRCIAADEQGDGYDS
jgi:hypothetical protein